VVVMAVTMVEPEAPPNVQRAESESPAVKPRRSVSKAVLHRSASVGHKVVTKPAKAAVHGLRFSLGALGKRLTWQTKGRIGHHEIDSPATERTQSPGSSPETEEKVWSKPAVAQGTPVRMKLDSISILDDIGSRKEEEAVAGIVQGAPPGPEAADPLPQEAAAPAPASGNVLSWIMNAATSLVPTEVETAKAEEEPTPEPPSIVEASVIKRGVPWRGSYMRTLVVDTVERTVKTVDPQTNEETNCFLSPRDVPTATVFSEFAESQRIELHTPMWPEAPPWTHARVVLTVPPTTDTPALLDALSRAGVDVVKA